MTQNNRRSQDELETLVMIAGMSMFAYTLWLTIKKFVLMIAKWVYGVITLPVYYGENHFGMYGGAEVCVSIGIIIAAISYYRHTQQKKNALLGFTFAGLWFFLAFAEVIAPAEQSLLTKNIRDFCGPTSNGLDALFSCQKTLVDLDQIGSIKAFVASFLPNIIIIWPAIFSAGAGVARVAKKHPDNTMTKKHDMESFIREQTPLYPHLSLVDLVNPNLLPINKGQLRIMDGTKRFCFENDLISGFMLRPNTISPDDYGKKFNERFVPPTIDTLDVNLTDKSNLVPIIDPDRFNSVMIKQLGEPWSGIDNIEPLELILLTIILPRACAEDTELTDEEFKEIKNKSQERLDYMFNWVYRDLTKKTGDNDEDRGFLDFDKLEEYKADLATWIERPLAKKIISKHAYTRTIIIACLEKARQIGVLPPCHLKWMKFYDRTLWAMVQNVGRPSWYCENLGASSHFLMEKTLDSLLNEPSFTIAYDGLVEQVRYFKFTEEEVEAWEKLKNVTGTDKDIILERLSDKQNERYEYDLSLQNDDSKIVVDAFA